MRGRSVTPPMRYVRRTVKKLPMTLACTLVAGAFHAVLDCNRRLLANNVTGLSTGVQDAKKIQIYPDLDPHAD